MAKERMMAGGLNKTQAMKVQHAYKKGAKILARKCPFLHMIQEVCCDNIAFIVFLKY